MSAGIAALQMYDWPENQAETDAFWTRVRDALATRGVAAPARLSRGAHAAPWADPDLVLAQTCGMPLVTGLCGAALPIARGDYGLPGTGPGTYTSAIVVRRADAGRDLPRFAGATLALNGWDSQSGRTALADAARRAGMVRGDAPVFGRAVVSGGHRDSARMVAGGQADLAALDAVSWALLQRFEPQTAEQLAVLAWTEPTAGLPFITARPGLAPALVAALAAAAAPGSPGQPTAILPATAADYAPIAAMVERARAMRLAPEQPPS